jgi:hypothetical protein
MQRPVQPVSILHTPLDHGLIDGSRNKITENVKIFEELDHMKGKKVL